MTIDLKNHAPGAPPGGSATTDYVVVLRDGAATPYTDTIDALLGLDPSEDVLAFASKTVLTGNELTLVFDPSTGAATRVAATLLKGQKGDPGTSSGGPAIATPLVRLYGGIGDGSAHTIGTAPSGHILAGKTTLAQVAAVSVNGVAPFAFVTQAPFTGSTWTLTDAKVANLDLDWLAIQACLWAGGDLRLPKGMWIIGSALPLPLMIRESTLDSPDVYGHSTRLIGEGQVASVIKAGSDFGAGVPLISCGDPSGTKVNELGRYNGAGAGFFRGSSVSCIGLLGPNLVNAPKGTDPCLMTGLAWGCGLGVTEFQANFFAKGISIVGDGHGTAFDKVSTLYCGYGCYWEIPSTYLYGDITFKDCSFAGSTRAGWGVHDQATILGVSTLGKTYLNGPYGILGEAGATGADLMSACTMDALMFEWIGNAAIHDENGFSGGVYGTGWKRKLSNVRIRSVYSSWQDGNFWGGSGRGRVAWFDCIGMDQVRIENFDLDSAEYSPTQGPSGPAPIALFRMIFAAGVINCDMESLASHLTTNNAQVARAGADMSRLLFAQPGSYSGRFLSYSSGGSVSKKYEAVARHFDGCARSGAFANRPLMGIALKASVPDGGVLPVILSGTTVLALQGPTTLGSQNRGLVADTTPGTLTTAPDGTPGFGWYLGTAGNDGNGNNLVAIALGEVAASIAAASAASAVLNVSTLPSGNASYTLAFSSQTQVAAYKLILTANCTIALSGGVAGTLQQIVLKLTQDGTGGRTVTPPSNVSWANGQPPPAFTAPGASQRWEFETDDGGTTAIGRW